MRLKRFDIGETCPGFPEDDRLVFRQERNCIIALVKHQLKKICVKTDGVRKVMLELEHGNGPGVVGEILFQGIVQVSWPVDFSRYFSADAERRSAMLTDAAEAAFTELARQRGWSVAAIGQVFAGVRKAGYQLTGDRVKALRSPDGLKRARVSYFADRHEFRIDVIVSDCQKNVICQKTIYRGCSAAALFVDENLGKPVWVSNETIMVPLYKSNNPDHRIVVPVP